MVLQGQTFTSLPSDLPSFINCSKIGRRWDFLPAYCSSTYLTAAARYCSGESSSLPFPSARSAIHPAELVPRLCFDFSHTLREATSPGPFFLVMEIHSSSVCPVFAGSSAIHLWSM